jgi:hypothetical protein
MTDRFGDHKQAGTNYQYGYNSYKQAAVGLWKINLAHFRDQRDKVNENIGTTMLHWFCNLIAFGATEHFVKDGDMARPAYGDKLANQFNDFLRDDVGIESQKQRDKYSAVVSGSLGIRKTKTGDAATGGPLPGLRMAAVDGGVPAIIAYLEKEEITTFNQLIAKVQPGADPMMALALRIANLNDEQRRKFEAALKVAMVKAEKKKKAEASKPKAPAQRANGAARPTA